jgi:hypothetical protein
VAAGAKIRGVRKFFGRERSGLVGSGEWIANLDVRQRNRDRERILGRAEGDRIALNLHVLIVGVDFERRAIPRPDRDRREVTGEHLHHGLIAERERTRRGVRGHRQKQPDAEGDARGRAPPGVADGSHPRIIRAGYARGH